jgi:hypothetical protein
MCIFFRNNLFAFLSAINKCRFKQNNPKINFLDFKTKINISFIIYFYNKYIMASYKGVQPNSAPSKIVVLKAPDGNG